MRRLRTKGDEVPEHVGILEVSLRVPLLGVDEAGEEEWVTDEEDGSVVPREVPDSLVGVELDGEASRITCSISTPTLSTWDVARESHGGIISIL